MSSDSSRRRISVVKGCPADVFIAFAIVPIEISVKRKAMSRCIVICCFEVCFEASRVPYQATRKLHHSIRMKDRW